MCQKNTEEFAAEAQRSYTVMYSELVGDCEGRVEDPNTDRIADSKLSSACFTGEQGLCQELNLKIFMLHTGKEIGPCSALP